MVAGDRAPAHSAVQVAEHIVGHLVAQGEAVIDGQRPVSANIDPAVCTNCLNSCQEPASQLHKQVLQCHGRRKKFTLC